MQKIIVTGGAGFIGSHLVDKLIENGNDVYVIDDLSGGKLENINSEAKFQRIDLRNPWDAQNTIEMIGPDIVYHLAANAAENKAQFSPIDVTSRNYSASINTLTGAIRANVKRFIYTSSIAVYGDITPPFREDQRPKPEDLYGITKYAFEESLKVMSKVHDFEYVIVRPHNVYGARQNMSDPYRNVVTIWMNSILKGEPYFIYGDGKQKRCFSYVSDVVEALYQCSVKNVHGYTFNVGADKEYTLNELSREILRASGSDLIPKHLPNRPQEVKIATADHSLAISLLNYKDKTSLNDGIKKTWEWAKKQGYQHPHKEDLELVNDKVPSNWL